MTLKLYNTMSRNKEEFVPLIPGKTSMYVCGVTVYDRSHIGHARCYVSFDLVYRYLKYKGTQVTYVRNFTDVDDKIIKRSNELGISARDLSSQNIELFLKDMDSIGCLRPDIEPRVSDHMAEIIETIDSIIRNGHGYEKDGTVYFSIDSFPEYGKLSGRKLDDMQAGASERVDLDPNKKNPMDFVLWKPSKEGEPSWESPWGEGRPGWHIECTAMSMKHLGTTFDIHGGGKDLIFPHHENEIAQSEASTGKPFANYWMHNGFVNVDQEKMSKSLGNFFTIAEVLEKYHPEALRIFLLGTHYRSPLNYSNQNLEEATARLEYFYDTIAKVDKAIAEGGPEGGDLLDKGVLSATLTRMDEALADDFNSAKALGYLYEPMKLANELIKLKKKSRGRIETLLCFKELVADVARLLGILTLEPEPALDHIRTLDATRLGIDMDAIEKLIQARTEARQAKDFQEADRIRDELLALSVMIMDNPTGTAWRITKKVPETMDGE